MFALIIFLELLFPNLQVQQKMVTSQSSSIGGFVPNQAIYDFGTILEKNGKVSHTFIFKNTGRTLVIINDAKTGCGCTTTNFTKSAILPGKTGFLSVTYDPTNKQGMFSKLIELKLNNGKSSTRCRIKGMVIPYKRTLKEDYPYKFGNGLYMNYQTIVFSSMKTGETNAIFLRIANNTNQKMRITFKRMPNNRVLKMQETLTLKPKERTLIPVSYTLYHKYSYNRHILIYPYVNGKQVKPLKVEWPVSK